MDDMELGQLCWAAYGKYPGPHNEGLRALGAAARALLAKPVATREAVKKWWDNEYSADLSQASLEKLCATLSHFAPPKTMIQGMSVEQVEDEMRKEYARVPDRYWLRSAAFVAHRLANTPAPEHDPDAEAKRLAWLQYDTAYPPGHRQRVFVSIEEMWSNETEQWRNGWRAVAAMEKGNE